LRATLISYKDGGTNLQLASQSDGSSVLIQISGAGRHREGTLQGVFSGKSDRGLESNPAAPAFRQQTPIDLRSVSSSGVVRIWRLHVLADLVTLTNSRDDWPRTEVTSGR